MFNPPNLKKYKKKKHKFSIKGIYLKNNLNIGKFGLKAIENGYLNIKQIEAARKAIIKQIKKVAKVYIKIHPNLGITKKPAETRMGKGKGNIVDWVCAIKSGKILFEIKSINKIKDNFLTEKKSERSIIIRWGEITNKNKI